jgi:hypothetical protein
LQLGRPLASHPSDRRCGVSTSVKGWKGWWASRRTEMERMERGRLIGSEGSAREAGGCSSLGRHKAYVQGNPDRT